MDTKCRYIVHVCTCSSPNWSMYYIKNIVTVIIWRATRMCVHTHNTHDVLREKGRQSNTTRHNTRFETTSFQSWVETCSHNFTCSRLDDLPQNDAMYCAYFTLYIHVSKPWLQLGEGQSQVLICQLQFLGILHQTLPDQWTWKKFSMCIYVRTCTCTCICWKLLSNCMY